VATVQRRALVPGLYCLGIALLLCGTLAAREQCGVEAKLLVSPRDVPKSVAALHAVRKSRGEVYLFDTDGLELLSQGVILRLRTGAGADLTVKIRSSEAIELRDPSAGSEIFKCEVDLVGNTPLTSYSLRAAWKGKQIPQTGQSLHAALSTGQLRLLTAAGVSIAWHQVRPMVQVEATDWEVYTDRPVKRVVVELWEWQPNGKILELSAKADPQGAASTMDQLRKMAAAGGLVVEDQEAKTSLALHAIGAASEAGVRKSQ
jgi:hypothetical protein